MGEIKWDVLSHIATSLLIVAILFEVALASLFNWGVWKKHISGLGLKIPVSINFALCFTYSFSLDVFSQTLTAIGYTRELKDIGLILTAMLIAGGSGGINELLKKWKIRKPYESSPEIKINKTVTSAQKDHEEK